MEAQAPSPQTTLLILLGASAWPFMPEFQHSEAFANAARRLKAYFLNPRPFGLPAENMLDLFDSEKSADELDVAIGEFLAQHLATMKATGNAARDLLLYFIGHGGFVGRDSDFYLAIRRTRMENPRTSGLPVLSLADTLTNGARYLRRIIVLDCCFAAAAFSAFQAGPDQVALEKTRDAFQVGHRAVGFPTKGTTLLCSSNHKSPSLLLPDGSSTMFTQAFVDTLVQGTPSQRDRLTLRDVKDAATDLLSEIRNAPKPVVHSPDQSEGDVADVAFFPNPYVERERARLAEEERRRQAEQARKVEEEKARRLEEEQTRKAEEEQARQAEEEKRRQAEEERRRTEQAEQARLASQERMRQIEEEGQHQAEIERQRLTPNETISPSLSSPGSVQSSNTAAAEPFLPLTSPTFIPGKQPGQEPPPGVVVASRITRRKIVVGLGLAGLTIAGGSIVGWALFHGQHPSPIPLGTKLYTYRGHSNFVDAVEWSPDGTRIASGSDDKTVQVWDAANGGHVFTYRGHSSTVDAVAWSPDDTRIASGSNDNTVQVWDAANGGHVFTYRGHSNFVEAVSWSPDSTRIASGSADNTVQVWDAANGGHLFTYRGYIYAVLAVAWSPDGTRIA